MFIEIISSSNIYRSWSRFQQVMDCNGRSTITIRSVRSVGSKKGNLNRTGGNDPSFRKDCNRALLSVKKIHKRRKMSLKASNIPLQDIQVVAKSAVICVVRHNIYVKV